MKIILLLLSLLIPTSVKAQQNFFNIPSGQITESGTVFYQHQLNVLAKENLSSKQHLVYGVAQDWEIGFNYINVDPLFRQIKTSSYDPSANIAAITTQKIFRIREDFSFNLGVIAGSSGFKQSTGKAYALGSYYQSDLHLRFTSGVWLSDERFNGRGDNKGVLLGAEWMFTDRWYLMGDWISGTTKNSVSVIGGMVDLREGVQVCLGMMIPNSGSQEGRGAVLELNLFTFD